MIDDSFCKITTEDGAEPSLYRKEGGYTVGRYYAHSDHSRGRRIAGWIVTTISAGILAAVAWRVLYG